MNDHLKTAILESVDDSGILRSGTASWLGRDGQPVQLASLYGIVHNPPEGSQLLLMPQNGQESYCIALPDHPALRPVLNLLPGEVGIVNYLTKSHVVFKANGDIEVFTQAGNLVATIAGNVTLTATGTLTAAATQINANGVIIDAAGNIVTTGTVTAHQFITV